MFKNKFGEITTQQIVLLIILIISFAVILIFIFILNPGGLTDAQICHNSVVLVDKGKGFVGELDCKTSYVCISGGEDCPDLSQSRQNKIKLNFKDKNDAKEKVIQTIADEMANCWWMFGEGKINYGNTQGSSVKYAICSIISFDEEIQKEIPKISYADLFNYMRFNEKEEGLTYLRYLYGAERIGEVDDDYFRIDISRDRIMTSERLSVVTGFDDNISPWPDGVLNVYVIPTDETSSRLTASNKEFITKS